MRLDQDTPRSLNARKLYATNLARQRNAARREPNTGERGLSYALLILVLFQTLLLSCAIFSFGGLLLLNFSNLYRPRNEADSSVLGIRTPAPAISHPLSPVAQPAATQTLVPAQPTAPVAPIASEAPTASPMPTATVFISNVNSPVAPVATLLPTPTITPANNLPTPGAVPAELQAYANQVLPILNNLSGAFENLRGLAQTLRIEDPQWVANLTNQIGIIQTYHEQLRMIQPPPPAQQVHNTLLTVMSICRTGTDMLSANLTNHDTNNLAAATPYIQNCVAQFPGAANQFHQWLATNTGNP